jgi:hypothetical protein
VIRDDLTFGNERSGVKSPLRGIFYQQIKTKLLLVKDTTKFPNILLIRSAANILNTTIKSLKSEFPDSKITVLAPESARESIENHPNIDTMISAGTINRMSVISIKNKAIKKIRNGQFDLTISLYNIDHGMGYSNIDFLAWISGAKSIRGYNVRGTFDELSGWRILKKYFLEKTSFTWFIINTLATVILFVFITLGLLLEWTTRKVLNFFSLNTVHSPNQTTLIAPQHEESSTVHRITTQVHQKT